MLGSHVVSDFFWSKDDITIPSADDICARVLNSHTICEDEGLFTPVAWSIKRSTMP